jgi:hypothetical protein
MSRRRTLAVVVLIAGLSPGADDPKQATAKLELENRCTTPSWWTPNRP